MHDIRPYLPELFTNPGMLLYIGARADAHSWLDELIEAGNEVDILEVWNDNINGLVPEYGKKCIILVGDVREVDKITANFDYIFWWHGPEHLAYDEIEPTLNKLESKCKRTIALATPWGVYPQGAHAGNPYEVHRCSLYPEFFISIGYEFAVDGRPDEPGSEIVAWKRME